jgi:Type II CAAX prenyl endopeptidase Rce1-like
LRVSECDVPIAEVEIPSSFEKDDSHQPTLSPLMVFIFFLFAVSSSYILEFLLKPLAANRFVSLVVKAGLYRPPVLLVISYVFSPQVFTKCYWQLPRTSWKWICGVGAAYGISLLIPPPVHQIPMPLAFLAIVIAPVVEEVARAVMICPLVERWGLFWGVVVTTVATSLVHASPHLVVLPELALSITLLATRRSIPAAALAHCIGNIIVVVVSGIARP